MEHDSAITKEFVDQKSSAPSVNTCTV